MSWFSFRKFDSLIKAQARELSHLRQRLRDGRGVCGLLIQHLGDTTKAFEELLRANDVDYYMGQSFREQLAQSGALAQRISARISGRESLWIPDERRARWSLGDPNFSYLWPSRRSTRGSRRQDGAACHPVSLCVAVFCVSAAELMFFSGKYWVAVCS